MEQEELQKITTKTLPVNGRKADENGDDANGIGSNYEESREDFEKESVQHVAEKAIDAVRSATAFVKVEKSLASLGFFTPSSRRIKNQKMKRISLTREVDGKRVEVSAEIHPSAVFGLPVTADQDKYLALHKIITNTLQSEGKITNPIRFKSAELLRLLDTSRKSGKNYKEVSEWLDVMSATSIFSDGAVYVSGKEQFVRDRFRVFDRAVSVGNVLEDGTVADANYVWLSAWQLENINNKFVIPIDLETYRELKNHISKALVPLLQVWLFASNKAGSFEKRYDELCAILTLQTYRSPSQILRQFKPSLDELSHHEYLEKWRIEKTADRKAYKIIFFHGPKFHRDRKRRLEQKSQAEPAVLVAEFEPVEPKLPEPGRLHDLPATLAAAEDEATADGAHSREVNGGLVDDLAARGLMPSAVLKLLESLPADRIASVRDYIEYWDSQKRVGEVRPGLLYELIKNGERLPSSFETGQKRAARLAAADRQKKLHRLQAALKAKYEDYRRATTDRFVAGALPPGELENRVATHKARILSQEGFWSERPEMAEQFARHAVNAEIAKGVSLLSYDDFRRQELPGVLSNLQLHPKELGIELSSSPSPDNVPAGALYAPPENVQPPDGGSLNL